MLLSHLTWRAEAQTGSTLPQAAHAAPVMVLVPSERSATAECQSLDTNLVRAHRFRQMQTSAVQRQCARQVGEKANGLEQAVTVDVGSMFQDLAFESGEELQLGAGQKLCEVRLVHADVAAASQDMTISCSSVQKMRRAGTGESCLNIRYCCQAEGCQHSHASNEVPHAGR